jgi:hypothetical protein
MCQANGPETGIRSPPGVIFKHFSSRPETERAANNERIAAKR